jgi:hypothetical protein
MIVLDGMAMIATPKGFSTITSESCYANLIEFSISILQKNYIFYPNNTSVLRWTRSSTRKV